MRTDDLRLLTAALVLLLTGAFLATPAKADPGATERCAFGAPGATDPDPPAGTDGWTAPTVRYRLSAGYAAKGRLWKHRHTGQDFAVDAGTPVYAVGPGQVVTTSCGDGYGNQIVLRHPDGYWTQYAHLSVILVRPGQQVAAGERIGSAGATGNADGPHLHFEVRTSPYPGSAVAPLPWLRGHGVQVSGDPAGLAQSSKMPAPRPPAPGNDQTSPHGSFEVRPPHHDGRPPAAAGLPAGDPTARRPRTLRRVRRLRRRRGAAGERAR
ncbi:M23 family metallopeptidase [Streptomyces sp. NPDC051985]|uniref:M23 family metallopeptidase n=1 Tax=Streptomyces sp. NPDC051985 TaxID=3155807 RepID=UPI003412FE23